MRFRTSATVDHAKVASIPPILWKAFASLILEAAYEATMAAALLNARRGLATLFLSLNLGNAFGKSRRLDLFGRAAVFRGYAQL
jgi:hypothetical protein